MVEFMISHMAKNFKLDLYRFIFCCSSQGYFCINDGLMCVYVQKVSGSGSPDALLPETLQDQTQLQLEGAVGR